MDLIKACKRGDTECIKRRLCGLVDVNFQDQYGKTALMWACVTSHPDIVKLLCEHGANPDIQDNSRFTALMWAIINHRSSIVQELCTCNLELKDHGGRTALTWAVTVNDYECVKQLCIKGARVVRGATVNLHILQLLTKQQFRGNVLVLVGHIQIELLRCVHEWI